MTQRAPTYGTFRDDHVIATRLHIYRVIMAIGPAPSTWDELYRPDVAVLGIGGLWLGAAQIAEHVARAFHTLILVPSKVLGLYTRDGPRNYARQLLIPVGLEKPAPRTQALMARSTPTISTIAPTETSPQIP